MKKNFIILFKLGVSGTFLTILLANSGVNADVLKKPITAEDKNKLIELLTVPGYINLYLAFQQKDFEKKAISSAEEIKKLNKKLNKDPENPEILYEIGSKYLELNDREKAKSYYEKAKKIIFDKLKEKEEGKLYLLLCKINNKNSEFEEAVQNGEKALEFSPNNAELYEILSIIYFFTKDPLKSIEYIKKAMELEPANIEHLGRYIFFKSLTIFFSEKLQEIETKNFLEMDFENFIGFKKEIETVLNSNNDFAKMYIILGKTLFLLFKFIALNEFEIKGNSIFLTQDKNLQEINKLEKILKDILKRQKNKPVYGCLGTLNFLKGDFKNGEKYFREEINLDKKYKNSYDRLFYLYYENKKFAEAIDLLKEKIKNQGENEEDYLLIAKVYFKQKNYEDSEEYLKKALEINKDFVRAKIGLSSIYIKQGDYEKAEDLLKEGLSEAEGYFNYGILKMIRGDYREAKEYLEKSYSLNQSKETKEVIEEYFY